MIDMNDIDGKDIHQMGASVNSGKASFATCKNALYNSFFYRFDPDWEVTIVEQGYAPTTRKGGWR